MFCCKQCWQCLQEETQAAYTALQVAEDRAASLQTQLEAAAVQAAAATNHKAGNSFCVWFLSQLSACLFVGCLSVCASVWKSVCLSVSVLECKREA